MIKIIKILCVIVISLISISKTSAEIKNALFATVGNKAITNEDIVNEIKIILILNNQSYSEEMKIDLQKMAVKSVIKRNIKKIEIEKYEYLEYSKQDFYAELNRISERISIDLETLKNLCASNGINWSDVENQIITELLWNSLIFQIYKDRLSINVEEIEDQLKLIQNKKEVEEFLVSEIIIKAVPQDKMKYEIDNLKKTIEIDGFEKTAMNLSISESSTKGGDLGWLNENVISNKFKSKIMSTAVGNMSEPILLPEGILFFKIRDKRKVSNKVDLEESKNQIVKAEKAKILNMHSLSHYDSLRRSISVKFF